MTYPESHYKVTVYGDAYNGSEHWSFGWRMRGGTLTDTAAQIRATAYDAPVTAFWTLAGLGGFYNTHRLQGVKVAVIGADGHYPDGHIPGEVFKANVPGPILADTGAYVLPQSSVCCTLTTAVPRGLASKGRFFLPPSQAQIASDGLMNDAMRDIVRGRVRDFLTAINNATVDTGDIAILSRGRGVPAYDPDTNKITYTYPNAGAVHDVTGVSVGRVIDTQRRRRRQLVESYEGAALG